MDDIFWLTILLIFIAGYYALAIMPRQQAFKRHQETINALQVGDEVITYSGIIGTILELDDEQGLARIKIAEGVEVQMLITALLQHYNPDTPATSPESSSDA